ncbi:MAG: hypothetical protein JW895_15590 [Thermoleophilaceae bacterium]|nr:hypothetical protein [Thermoleophilaceae bacterium]
MPFRPARLLPVALVGMALLGAGCGGDDQPGYCSDLDDLQQSVGDLSQVDVVEGGKSAVTDALQKVETSARSTVDSAKADFPDETGAISDSVAALETSARALADSPSAAQGARVAGDVAQVVNSVDDFADATSSNCE